MGLILITPAAEPPVTLAELKAYCAVEDSSADTVLTAQLLAALGHVEMVLDRVLGAQVWELAIDDFADVIELPRGPVLSIVANGFTYVDQAGASQVVSSALYSLDIVSRPQRIVRNDGESWPVVDNVINAVRLRFNAGYIAATLPADLKLAVLALAAFWFENRGDASVPAGVTALLAPHRRMRI